MLQNNFTLNHAYHSFYRAYNMFNRIAWGGRLPACVIRFSRRKSRRTLAFATNCFPRRITFNIDHCLRFPEFVIWGVLAHEMTHIWQYTNGQSGWHNSSFYRELQRVGIDEKAGVVLPDSPANYIFTLNEMYRISLTSSLQDIKIYGKCDTTEFASQYFLNNTSTQQ